MTDPKELGEFLIAVANGRGWRKRGSVWRQGFGPMDVRDAVKNCHRYELEPEQKTVYFYRDPCGQEFVSVSEVFKVKRGYTHVASLPYTDDQLEKGE